MTELKKSVVACVPCDNYDPENVYHAVRRGLDLIGGILSFVDPGEKILLKPNLLTKAPPQKAITTHPAVFEAVIRILTENGCTGIKYGDSPGNPVVTPQKAADESGIERTAKLYGIPQADFSSGQTVSFPSGIRCKSFCLCPGVLEADAVINICKMKTHALERITGAVKNLYGCVYSVNKAAGHAKYPNSDSFAEMLADLNACVSPRLHIMDGITAMEGNGPTSGTPVDMKVLLFSKDPVALDAVFACLVGLSPADVPTCVSAQNTGIGTADPKAITVKTPDGDITVAEAVRRFGKPDFDVERGKLKKGLAVKLLPLLPKIQDRPEVDLSLCTGCGLCEKACPVPEKAVHSGKGLKARYDYHSVSCK